MGPRAAQLATPRQKCGTNMPEITVVKAHNQLPTLMGSGCALWQGDVEVLLAALPAKPLFDLVVTSPPYNLGKSYEKKAALKDYLVWQERIIDLVIPRLAQTGSICWQVGNYVDNGQIMPLDIQFDPVFRKHGLALRDRIIWHFGHGLHNKCRCSFSPT